MSPPSSRWIPRSADALLLSLLASPVAFAVEPPPAALVLVGQAPASQSLYLEVVLNQGQTGQVLPFVQRDGRLLATVATLRQLGFILPGRAPGELLAPEMLPGVSVRFDPALQRVAIDAPLSLLSLATTVANAPEQATVPASSTPGLLLNYDLYGSADARSQNLSAFAELRAFGVGAGVLSQTAVTRGYRDRGAGWHGDSVRLDSSWRWSSPESMLSVTVGDTLSGNLGWSRQVRLGGVRAGRDFGLQPYRITMPLPAFLGEVAVPSAVELYVEGIKQYSGQLPVGPFQLTAQPGVSGTGEAQLVVTDAFGRSRTLDFAFYAAPQLLAKDLSDWSLAFGMVREDYGLRSLSYGDDPVASGSLRYGISDTFTVESHAEAGDALVNAGAGAAWTLGRAGVFSASFAHGRQHADAGWQYAAAWSWNNGCFHVALDRQRTDGDYRDLAALHGQSSIRVSERALLGWNGATLGNLALNYVHLQYQDAEPSRYAGANWTRGFGRNGSLSLSLNQNLDRSRDRNLFLGYAYSFDSRTSVNASLQRNGGDSDATLDLTRPVPGDGGFGWRMQARDGDSGAGGLAEAGWLARAGRYHLGVARQGGSGYGYASASGSLVSMGGQMFAARTIGDAFAVVSTDGVAGVPVKLENRLIGRTNAAGMLLVTPLNAWQRNRLAIDPMDLPVNVRVREVEVEATPSDRSGMLVRFELASVRAALIVLHDADGRPLPLGSRVRLRDGAAEAVVGHDGETYFDALDAHNVLQVDTPAGACRVTFYYPAGASGLPRLGPLTCVPEFSL